MADFQKITKTNKERKTKKVKKTLISKMGVGQPKTMIEALALTALKIALCGVMGLLGAAGFLWTFTHDQTNVEAKAEWSEQAKELEARIDFEKAHPKVSF